MKKKWNKVAEDLIKVCDELYESANKLYDISGQYTVMKFGYDVGLPNGYCPACECNVPVLINPKTFDVDCLVCGSQATNREWKLQRLELSKKQGRGIKK